MTDTTPAEQLAAALDHLKAAAKVGPDEDFVLYGGGPNWITLSGLRGILAELAAVEQLNDRLAAKPQVEWRPFGYDDRKATAPPHRNLVWINELFYAGVALGYFDGNTFRTSAGSDDCEVSHWALIEYPVAPEVGDPGEGKE